MVVAKQTRFYFSFLSLRSWKRRK